MVLIVGTVLETFAFILVLILLNKQRRSSPTNNNTFEGKNNDTTTYRDVKIVNSQSSSSIKVGVQKHMHLFTNLKNSHILLYCVFQRRII